MRMIRILFQLFSALLLTSARGFHLEQIEIEEGEEEWNYREKVGGSPLRNKGLHRVTRVTLG